MHPSRQVPLRARHLALEARGRDAPGAFRFVGRLRAHPPFAIRRRALRDGERLWSVVSERTVEGHVRSTLAKLQPLYKHTEPSSWSHGYGVQFVNASGNFIHINVPILDGESMLAPLLKAS